MRFPPAEWVHTPMFSLVFCLFFLVELGNKPRAFTCWASALPLSYTVIPSQGLLISILTFRKIEWIKWINELNELWFNELNEYPVWQSYKNSLLGNQQDGCVSQSACCHAWWPEFNPQDPRGRRSPASCPPSSTHTLWHACTPLHTQRQINKCNF